MFYYVTSRIWRWHSIPIKLSLFCTVIFNFKFVQSLENYNQLEVKTIKLIENAEINVVYLFLIDLDAILPRPDDLSFVSRRWFEAVLVSCFESRRTVSRPCRGLYSEPSWLDKSPTGLNNDEAKLLVESVPYENNQRRFLRRRHTSAIFNK